MKYLVKMITLVFVVFLLNENTAYATGTLDFTLDQIRGKISEEMNSIETFEYESFEKVERVNNDNNNTQVYAFYKNELPSAILIKGSTSNDYLSDLMLQTGKEIEKLLDDDSLVVMTYNSSDSAEKYYTFIADGNISSELLIDIASDINQNSFFNLNRDTIKSLLESFQFNDLYNLALLYNNNNPNDSQSSYIVQKIEPLLTDIEKITIVTDDFTGEKTAYYSDLKSLDSSVHFLPYLKRYTVSVDAGFTIDDWLFSNAILMSIDGEVYDLVETKSSRDVNDDATITEIHKSIPIEKDEIVENLKKAKNVSLRFVGSKGNYDYQLSENELQAWKLLYNLSRVIYDIDNESFRYTLR